MPIETIYLIYPYYENPSMLEKQVENWNSYSGLLGKKVHIILIDDASPNNPAEPIFKKVKHKKTLIRVKENIPWAQHHARNVGALEAGKLSKEENPWLFMSDMDILLNPETLYEMMEMEMDPRRFHTFERNFAGNVREPKYHCNTFLVKYDNYWAINGYDCDYCGTYGGDGPFLRQLDRVAPQLHHGFPSKHISQHVECTKKPILLWGYEPDMIADANTREWERYGDMKKKYRVLMGKKRREGDERSKDPIRWEYEVIEV